MARKRRGRGEGSIHFNEDKKLWIGQISLGHDSEGKRIRESVFGKTKKEVQAQLLELQRDALTGPPVRLEKLTLAQHFEDWLRVKKVNVRESTYTNYATLCKTHIEPVLGAMLLVSLNYRQINAFYEHLDGKGLSKRTVAYVAYLLRTALDDAVKKGLIRQNPSRLAASRTYKTEEARCLTQNETRAFLKAAGGERLEDAFVLALHTGLRPGEWLGLTWDCVDFENKKITVTQSLNEIKGHMKLGDVKTAAGRRTITLSETTVKALRRQDIRQKKMKLKAGQNWNNELNLVFTNSTGGPLRRTTIARRDFKRILRRAGLEGQGITLHSLRHTHASILIFQGADIKVISHRLGHENIVITLQTYGHLLPGHDERAAAKMDAFTAALELGS